MDPRLLTEKNWKDVAAKLNVKDNGLQKALAAYEQKDEKQYDERIKALASVSQLAAALKKAKDVVALAPGAKYLGEVVSAAEAEKSTILKAKSEAAKLEAMTAKKAAANGEEDEEDQGDYRDKLLASLQKLKGAKDTAYEFAVCMREEEPRFALMVAKKITPGHKKILLDAGGKRWLNLGDPAQCKCRFENGRFTFTPEKPINGLARKLQDSIKFFTGKKFPITMGAESAGDDDEPLLNAVSPGLRTPTAGEAAQPAARADGPLGLTGAVGRGGKNDPEDVKAVQEALNRRIRAGVPVNGKCDVKTIKAIMQFQMALGHFRPDGLIEPRRGIARALASNDKLPPPPEPPKPAAPPKLPKPTLAAAPKVWHSTRGLLSTNINELKKGVRAYYGAEHPDLLKQIEDNMQKLGVVLDKLDDRLATALEKAHAAANDGARKVELKNAKGILAEYIKYVKTEPLIDHMDSNPFGVKTSLKKMLTDSLIHMAQAIG